MTKYIDIRNLKFIVLAVIIFLFLNLYWILPLMTAKDMLINNIGEEDFKIYASKIENFSDLFNIASMYGFWREGYIYAKDFIPYWQLLSIFIILLAIYGFISYYKDEKIGYMVKALGVIGIIGLILATGINGPFGDLNHWLYDNTILKGFRDSHKFVSMMVLSYAMLGGLGVNKIKNMYDSRVAYDEIRCKNCKKILSEDDKICPICGCNNKIYSVSTELKAISNISIGIGIKRGDKSWNYFVVAWGISSALVLAVEAVIDVSVDFKIILMLFSNIVVTYLCFFNKWTRNKIVSTMSKSQDMIERY